MFLLRSQIPESHSASYHQVTLDAQLLHPPQGEDPMGFHICQGNVAMFDKLLATEGGRRP